MYRVCCPCLYKRQKRQEEKEEKGDDTDEKKETKKSSSKTDDDEHDDEKGEDDPNIDAYTAALRKYPTIVQLTNATVVTKPPPIFTRYMLRKSVDRLNAEVRLLFLSLI